MQIDTGENRENCPRDTLPLDFDEITGNSLMNIMELFSRFVKHFYWAILTACRLLGFSVIKIQLILHVVLLILRENNAIDAYVFINDDHNRFKDAKKINFNFWIKNRLH